MRLRDKLGLCQWFHFEDYNELHQTVQVLQELGIKHLRTGISWADFYRPGGKKWYDHQMQLLKETDIEVLLSIWHTPPSISEGNCCASPPRRLQDYADFIDFLITEYGDAFSSLELWNEPNNRLKWNFQDYDPMWEKFGAMLSMAAHWARQRGVKTVLGGMIPVDPHWLQLMEDYGVLQHMDVVGIHGFPGMWWEDAPNWDWFSHWNGWEEKIDGLNHLTNGRPVWITETGLATWHMQTKLPAHHDMQVEMLQQAIKAPAERVYWYSAIDLHPEYDAIEGFHVDENEYHLGLVEHGGNRKPAFYAVKSLLDGEPDSLSGSQLR